MNKQIILTTNEVIDIIKNIYRYTMLNRSGKTIEEDNVLFYGVSDGVESRLVGQGHHKEYYNSHSDNTVLPTVEPNKRIIHRWLNDSEKGNYISLDGRKIFESIGNNQWIQVDEIYV